MENINSNAWTEKEDDIIKQYYPTEAVNITKKLPGRMREEYPKHNQSHDTNIQPTEEK